MKHDCIIVLSNEMDKNGNLNLESISRIQLACKYFFNDPTKTLITCGWNYRKDSSLFIGNVVKDYAIKLGVPKDKIITELNSRDTVGDAFFTKQIISTNKEWNNLLIVTSEYHVKRSSRIFNFIYGCKYTIKVVGCIGFISPENMVSENKSLEAFEETFKNTEAGNYQKIYERLITRHPFYNGVVFPKIEMTYYKNEN